MTDVLKVMAAADDNQVGIERIRHMLQAAAAVGYVLAPLEPSEAMIDAGVNPERGKGTGRDLGGGRKRYTIGDGLRDQWRAMIAAQDIQKEGDKL